MRWPTVRECVGVLVIAGAYFGAAKLGQTLRYTASVSAIWPPAGVGIAVLYLFGLRWWPGIFLGELLVNGQLLLEHTDLPLGSLIGQQAGNMAEVIVGAWLLRRLIGPRARLDRASDVGGMILAAGTATAISATVVAIDDQIECGANLIIEYRANRSVEDSGPHDMFPDRMEAEQDRGLAERLVAERLSGGNQGDDGVGKRSKTFVHHDSLRGTHSPGVDHATKNVKSKVTFDDGRALLDAIDHHDDVGPAFQPQATRVPSGLNDGTSDASSPCSSGEFRPSTATEYSFRLRRNPPASRCDVTATRWLSWLKVGSPANVASHSEVTTPSITSPIFRAYDSPT